jgi:hypothetical protein
MVSPGRTRMGEEEEEAEEEEAGKEEEEEEEDAEEGETGATENGVPITQVQREPWYRTRGTTSISRWPYNV